jgi:hypothetical protein
MPFPISEEIDVVVVIKARDDVIERMRFNGFDFIPGFAAIPMVSGDGSVTADGGKIAEGNKCKGRGEGVEMLHEAIAVPFGVAIRVAIDAGVFSFVRNDDCGSGGHDGDGVQW